MFISIHAPLAGRDLFPLCQTILVCYFNPRAPCGARPSPPAGPQTFSAPISIHAPLAGRDLLYPDAKDTKSLFQSTRPLRGATLHGRLLPRTLVISIHAPLAGRDGRADTRRRGAWQFQSTRPLRGATPASLARYFERVHFNPRAPCGARQQKRTKKCGTFAQKV